jgi:hypothetical protein
MNPYMYIIIINVMYLNLKLCTIFSSQVSPELYGDSRPRLFTYWTVSTSCCRMLVDLHRIP